MDAMKHTPGPWRLESSPHSPSYYVIGADGMRVVTVHSYAGLTGDLDAANARLIAAAPELLEACNDIAQQCGVYDDGRTIPAEVAVKLIHQINIAARAAIAKAEGRAEP